MALLQREEWGRARAACGGWLSWTGWPDEPPAPIVIAVPAVVGIPEIAARLNVKRDTVDMWIQRRATNGFPQDDPERSIGGRPAWELSTIEDWARATGRL